MASAAEDDFPYESANSWNYLTTERYGKIVSSSLYEKDNKLFRAEILTERVESPYYEGSYMYNETPVLRIEEYDSEYNYVSGLNVPCELDRIAGFYIGKNANYIVSIQNNPEEDENREVFRVTKYTSDWSTRLGSAGVFGSNTTVPADAGSLRFAEFGNYLYIHTCHEMYTSSDGLNHQANMTFIFDTVNMQITFNRHNVWNTSSGYVSHSFNQFIAVDEKTGSIITADHGDAYPRTIALFRFSGAAGMPTLGSPEYIDVFDIAGGIGDNTTNVSMGDLTVTKNNYIVAFNSDTQGASTGARNVYLAVVPKLSFSESSVNVIKLTDYINYQDTTGVPYVTDIGNGKYLVMWEKSYNRGYIEYVLIDENGTKLSSTYTMKGYLSDCHPIVIGDNVMWYTNTNPEPVYTPVFYQININDIEDNGTVICSHEYNQYTAKEPTCAEKGIKRYECTLCGYCYDEDITNQPAHEDNNYDGKCDSCLLNMSIDGILTWNKDAYTTDDEEAVLTVRIPEGTAIVWVDATNSYNCYIEGNKIVFYLDYYEAPNDITVYFTNGTYAVTRLTAEINSSDEPDSEAVLTWDKDEYIIGQDSYAVLTVIPPLGARITRIGVSNCHLYERNGNNIIFDLSAYSLPNDIFIEFSDGTTAETSLFAITDTTPVDYRIEWYSEDDTSADLYIDMPMSVSIRSIECDNPEITVAFSGRNATFHFNGVTTDANITIMLTNGQIINEVLRIEKAEEPLPELTLTWDKDEYTTEDKTAKLSIDGLPESVYIDNVYVSLTEISDFTATVNTNVYSNYLEFILPCVTLSCDVTIVLSTGDTLTSELTVTEVETQPDYEIIGTWDKNSYTTDDELAVITFTGLPEGTYITDMQISYRDLIFMRTKGLSLEISVSGKFMQNETITVTFSTGDVYTATLSVDFPEIDDPTPTAPKGDFDGNGKITAADARAILRIAARIDEADENAIAVCDYNGDGKVTAMDARSVLRVAAKIDEWVK